MSDLITIDKRKFKDKITEAFRGATDGRELILEIEELLDRATVKDHTDFCLGYGTPDCVCGDDEPEQEEPKEESASGLPLAQFTEEEKLLEHQIGEVQHYYVCEKCGSDKLLDDCKPTKEPKECKHDEVWTKNGACVNCGSIFNGKKFYEKPTPTLPEKLDSGWLEAKNAIVDEVVRRRMIEVTKTVNGILDYLEQSK